MDLCLQRILSLIDEKGISAKDFAVQNGFAMNAVSDWKTGKVTSYRKHLDKIATFFDVSVDYLMGRTDFKSPGCNDPFAKQYELADSDVQKLVNRLLGLKVGNDGKIVAVKQSDEEDMSAIVELVAMFDSLSLIGKSRIISAAADEIEKAQK